MLIFILLAVFVISIVLYSRQKYNYWKQRGVKHDKPYPIVGNNLKQFLQKASYCMMATEMYQKYPEERVVGFYRGMSPELVIRDPDIMKRILITDFQHFYGRGFIPRDTRVVEPLMKNLFFADGDLWKLVRQRFTPSFSTSKLRAMFPLITDRAEKMQKLAEEVSELEYYDVRELMARYTTDFIGACGFGINMDSLSDENSQFRWLGKRIFHRNFMDAVRGGLKILFPRVFQNLDHFAPEIESSMVHLVTSILKERNYKPAGKNDFIDLFLELKQQGKLVGESVEHRNPDGYPKIVELEFTDMILIAQVFVFFGAGFETSSSTSSFTLHQLAFHPECQQKAQEETDRVLAKHNGKLTYAAINEMKYLEMCFYESMRLYPSVGFLMRVCESPKYTFPELDLTIDRGVQVIIPIQAMHRDEKYFPEPMKYDPERFRDGIKDVKKFYLPFGEGPRACVGARLGQMQSMAGIAAVLQNFTVEPAKCSKRFPDPNPEGIVSESFIGGLPLKLIKRRRGSQN